MREETDHGEAWAIGSCCKVLTILAQITLMKIIIYNDGLLKNWQ
jgi:hypothetical protein